MALVDPAPTPVADGDPSSVDLLEDGVALLGRRDQELRVRTPDVQGVRVEGDRGRHVLDLYPAPVLFAG